MTRQADLEKTGTSRIFIFPQKCPSLSRFCFTPLWRWEWRMNCRHAPFNTPTAKLSRTLRKKMGGGGGREIDSHQFRVRQFFVGFFWPFFLFLWCATFSSLSQRTNIAVSSSNHEWTSLPYLPVRLRSSFFNILNLAQKQCISFLLRD